MRGVVVWCAVILYSGVCEGCCCGVGGCVVVVGGCVVVVGGCVVGGCVVVVGGWVCVIIIMNFVFYLLTGGAPFCII